MRGPEIANRLIVVFARVRDEVVGHCWDGVTVHAIADRARHTGAAAAAGSIALPRPIRMVFTDPAAVVAPSAELHGSSRAAQR